MALQQEEEENPASPLRTQEFRFEMQTAAYLSNLTRDELVVVGRGVEVRLPPLARRYPVAPEQWRGLDKERLATSPDVEVALFRDATTEDATQRWLGMGAIVGVLLAGITWFAWGGILAGLLVYVGLMTVSVALVYSIGSSSSPTELDPNASASSPSDRDVPVGWLQRSKTAWARRSRPTPGQLLDGVADTLVPTFVMVVGFGAALLVSWHVVTGQPMSTLISEPGAIAQVAGSEYRTGSQQAVELALRTFFLGIVITFPAAMYFTFERQRGDALRTRFVLDVFRLDDRLRNVDAVRARYGSRMRDVFGDEGDSPGAASSRHGLRFNAPILISTIVLALAVVVVYSDLYGENATTEGPAIAILVPYMSVVAFALLGAYFYGLNTAIRGYFRGDLQPKTYSQISGRVLKVVILCALIWVIFVASTAGRPLEDLMASPGAELGMWELGLILAFFIGVVPNTFITWVYELLRKRIRLDQAKLVEAQPLTDLQGVDLYDRARLEQEGVTNLEALVHGELVDLMLQTRIPTGRLVDWLDQAVLLLYTDDVNAAETTRPSSEAAGRRKDDPPGLAEALHNRGIRAASQLLCECRRSKRPREDPINSLRTRPPSQSEVRAFGHEFAAGEGLSAVAMENALLGMLTEPSMRRVLSWKANPAPQERYVDAREVPSSDVVPAPATGQRSDQAVVPFTVATCPSTSRLESGRALERSPK